MKFSTRAVVLSAGLLSFALGVGPAIGAQDAGSTLDDAAITTSIKASLLKDQHLKAFDIHVDTTHGIVHLSGVVDSRVERADAERIASTTKGVTDVKSDITVK